MYKPTEKMKRILGDDCPDNFKITPMYSQLKKRKENGESSEEIFDSIENEIIRVLLDFKNGKTKKVVGECKICYSFLLEEEEHECDFEKKEKSQEMIEEEEFIFEHILNPDFLK